MTNDKQSIWITDGSPSDTTAALTELGKIAACSPDYYWELVRTNRGGGVEIFWPIDGQGFRFLRITMPDLATVAIAVLTAEQAASVAEKLSDA